MPSISDRQPDSEPSPDMVEAWLAGTLTEEQNEAVERHFAEQPDAALNDNEFRELDTEAPSEEVDSLIAQILTDGDPAPPDAEDWRSILDPTDDPRLLGTLGKSPRYEVNSVIAVGGMSIVFKGRDPALDRTVALKALTPGLAANHLTRERFLREARVAAKLDHENILPIHGVHENASVPFFAMKFVGGGTLQDALEGDPLPFEKQRSIARQVASALAVAHVAGVIHRDIKPANILLDADGQRAWLCDFGIARSTEDPSLTYAGSIAGTPHYMSPEQATGGALDGRSDLFSLGAVLYRCATGEHVFPGITSAAVLRQVQTRASATLTLPKKAKPPRWYENLLANLLAKDPRDRPTDATAVVRAIDDEHSPRAKHTARRNKRIAVAAIMVIGLPALSMGILQVPAVKDFVNTTLLNRSEEEPVFDGKLEDGEIEIAKTGERFERLSEAIEVAPSGATLLLSGWIAPSKEIVVTDKTIHLEAAPGAQPTIVGTIPDDHAIFLWAGGSIKGIRFLRENAGPDTMPVLGIRPEGGSFLVEDCVFESIPAEPGAGSPFIITDGIAAELRRCVFINPGGSNMGLYFRDRVQNPMAVKLEDCLFVGNDSIQINSRVQDTTLRLSAERCIFVTDHLLSLRPRSPLSTTNLSFTDCIIDCQSGMLSLTDTSTETLGRHLSWAGQNNIYREGTPVLETPLSAQGFRQPAPLNRFEDLATPILNFSEVSPTHCTPFDRTKLKTPISQASLLGVLDPSIESPAIQRLRVLSTTSP